MILGVILVPAQIHLIQSNLIDSIRTATLNGDNRGEVEAVSIAERMCSGARARLDGADVVCVVFVSSRTLTLLIS